ncbi:uncharacterized protein LOC123306877 [Coccinella septempunctata]|uniref:uncharacterized protein LOC123306877 n=1 Tax=Coccinella septempunctata TaxID=41139 RepID=UPI001D0722B0|nr:uncharacterized protein LOC123306877 [Coccinella septempunctata]
MPGMNNIGQEEINPTIGRLPLIDEKGLIQPERQREITQTDHLNKKLLTAFLGRINETPSLNDPKDMNCNNDSNEFEL